jgi:hypothetical protein
VSPFIHTAQESIFIRTTPFPHHHNKHSPETVAILSVKPWAFLFIRSCRCLSPKLKVAFIMEGKEEGKGGREPYHFFSIPFTTICTLLQKT